MTELAGVTASGTVPVTVPAAIIQKQRNSGFVMPTRRAPVVENCVARHNRTATACDADSGCRANVLRAWEVCEATGFWPE